MQNEDKQGLSDYVNETKKRFMKAGTGAVTDLDGDHTIFADLGEAVGKSEVAICDTTSNPAPLGLFAFGLTTVLLNLHNAGFFPLDSMILAMGIFYGGAAQVIVGIMEWKKKNTFGTVAFTSYGLFWLTLVGLIIIPVFGWAPKPTETSMIAFLVLWGIFSTLLFIGTFALNRALQVVFFLVLVLFFMLAYGDYTGNAGFKILTGCEGILTGVAAIYTGVAQVWNEMFGKTVLPLGPVKNK
jgi:succinate-acetate transporter protein